MLVMAKEGRGNPQLAIRFDPAIIAKLKRIGQATGERPVDLVRRAVLEFIERRLGERRDPGDPRGFDESRHHPRR